MAALWMFDAECWMFDVFHQFKSSMRELFPGIRSRTRNDSVGVGERARLGCGGPRPRGPHRASAKPNHSVRVGKLRFGARAHRTTAEAAVLPNCRTESFRAMESRWLRPA